MAAKLRPPPPGLPDPPHPPEAPDAPARDPDLALARRGAGRLPRDLAAPRARAEHLARFAHHELMAVELFAWALLAFPDAPPALRRGFLFALAEEQEHCRLYLDRLAAHGARLEDFALGDYFWKHVPAIRAAESPILAFLAAMGLTLEAANLDFTLMYRDRFREAGDEETARVIQRVHDDEVGHVKLAATWVAKLSGQADVDAYARHVPFPLSAARAKGRRFDRESRVRAGLSDDLIARVEDARPYG